MKGVAILGSTGSVGTAALRVIERQQARFRVAALTANANALLLEEQARRITPPPFVGLVCARGASPPGWRAGPECLVEAATRPDVDIVLNAIVGAVGLDATLGALAAGKRVALANKETLVVAGELVTATAAAGGGEIVPVDSEHSAILQCLARRPAHEVRRLILTASGGPFRGWSRERLERATVADALQHPTWRMGRKITVDSATLANKALEVIEAHFLFGVPYERIQVVVHPQSIVHSFVEFVDGSVLAQLGVPNMELPILYALTHPERVPDAGVAEFDPVAASPLTFEAVRESDFPAFALGVAAGRAGGAAPAVFNAANEAAVALFLEGGMRFADIAAATESALARLAHAPARGRDDLLAADVSARAHVREWSRGAGNTAPHGAGVRDGEAPGVLTSIVATLRDHVPWLAPILVFGLVIFVHELGHFLAAKSVGVYAPRFSIGFGPTLWRHRWGETEYRIGALPLGGYVRMASRDDDASALLEGGAVAGREGAPAAAGEGSDPGAMLPFGPRPIPADRWFESQPLPARLAIMFAGVTMNALLALAVAIGILAYYGQPSVRSVQRSAPVIADVLPGSAAEQAGLASGDSVVAVDGVPVRLWSDVVDRIRPAAGQRIVLGVLRNGAARAIAVVPRSAADTNPETGVVTSIGRIGASVRAARDPMPLHQAVTEGWSDTWAMVGTTISALHDLATGRTSLRSLNGPLRIAQVSVEAARSGFEQLLTLLAFLSINVAVFNLLPIPILDGGAIVLTLLESVKGGPFSLRTREYVLRAGLIAIALLFMLVMYNDRCVISFFC